MDGKRSLKFSLPHSKLGCPMDSKNNECVAFVKSNTMDGKRSLKFSFPHSKLGCPMDSKNNECAAFVKS